MKNILLISLIIVSCSKKNFTFIDYYRTTAAEPVFYYNAHYKLTLHEKDYNLIIHREEINKNTFIELHFLDSSILYVQADEGLYNTPNYHSVINKYGKYPAPSLDTTIFKGTSNNLFWKEIIYPDLKIGYLNVPDSTKPQREKVLYSLKLVKKEPIK